MADFFMVLFDNIKIFRIRDLIDIAIVAFVIYHGIKLIKETRASQLIKGIIALVVFAQIADMLQLNSVNFILDNTLQLGLIALLVVFQPELRRTLEKVGSAKFTNLFKINDEVVETYSEEVSTAVRNLARTKTGALIIMERQTKLGEITDKGIPVDSCITDSLLENIFVPNTPLHDGAVIISGGRIKAAACVLPLTEKSDISKELGTRHRAAIGVSEIADCIAIVVSEETGNISVAMNGEIKRGYDYKKLKNEIDKMFAVEKPSDNLKKIKNNSVLNKVVKKK